MTGSRSCFVAKAPSSAMLFGEHAVLKGKTACVAAVDRYLTVQLTPRSDSIVSVSSSLSTCNTNIKELIFPHELRFVQESLKVFREVLPSGCDITIESDVPHTVGLGSSASVTVATVAALTAFVRDCSIEEHKREILLKSVEVIRKVQGRGSGADAASIVYGGVISYKTQGTQVEKLIDYLPLNLFYCGYKTPTPKVIEIVSAAESQDPNFYHLLYEIIEKVTLKAIDAIFENNLWKIGQLMNRAHSLMESLGVSTKELSNIAWQARSIEGVYGSKISGSGLGDSIIILGKIDNPASIQIGGMYVPGDVSQIGVTLAVKECSDF